MLRRLAKHRRRSPQNLHLEELEARCVPAVALDYAHVLNSPVLDSAQAVATDAAGNVYMAGSFEGTVDFDFGPGVSELTSTLGEDIFVAKYTSAGELIWARHMGGNNDDRAYGLAVDDFGNVYTTGEYQFEADFDPGAGEELLTSTDDFNAFVSKLNSAGEFVWVVDISDPDIRATVGRDIEVDAAGNTYVTGDFRNYFNGSFVTKLDVDGGLLWSNPLTPITSNAIALDAGGNVLVTGFGLAVSKFDNDGNLVWEIPEFGQGEGEGIDTDASGNVYVTGFFLRETDFDPGPGEFLVTPPLPTVNNDAYIWKLDADGAFVWLRRVSSTGRSNSDFGHALRVAADGLVYVTGTIGENSDLPDPRPDVLPVEGGFPSRAFVLAVDADGLFQWSASAGGNGIIDPEGIAVDHAGGIYTVGHLSGPIDFDPGPDVFQLTSIGLTNGFLWKLVPASDTTDPTDPTDPIDPIDPNAPLDVLLSSTDNFTIVGATGSPTNILSVKIFDGSGNLVSTVQPFNNLTSLRVAAGDFDGDGRANEFAVLGRLQSDDPGVNLRAQIVTYHLDATGTPTETGRFFAFTPDILGNGFIAAGDLDGDGDDDLAVAQIGGGRVVVTVQNFLAIGGGAFQMAGSILVDFRIVSAPRLAAGDVDGDGFDELVIAARTPLGAEVRILHANNPDLVPQELGGFVWDIGITGYDRGAFVAVGEFDPTFAGEEIVLGSNIGGLGRVDILGYTSEHTATLSQNGRLTPFGDGYVAAVRVATGQVGGRDVLIVGQDRFQDGQYIILARQVNTGQTNPPFEAIPPIVALEDADGLAPLSSTGDRTLGPFVAFASLTTSAALLAPTTPADFLDPDLMLGVFDEASTKGM